MSKPKTVPIVDYATKFETKLIERRLQQNATKCNASATDKEAIKDQIFVLPGHDLVVTEEPESPGPQPKEQPETPLVDDPLAQRSVPEHGNAMPKKSRKAAKIDQSLAHSLSEIIESYMIKPPTPDLDREALSESHLTKLEALSPNQAYSAILEGCGYSQSRIAHMISVNRTTIWRWSRGQSYRYFKTETELELSKGIKNQVMGLALGVIQSLEIDRLRGALETSELLALLKTLLPFIAVTENKK